MQLIITINHNFKLEIKNPQFILNIPLKKILQLCLSTYPQDKKIQCTFTKEISLFT